MLAQEAVARAYREAAIKGVNSPPLSSTELDEGLSRLNGFLSSLFGAEIGENLIDWPVPTVKRTAPIGVDPVALPFPANQTDTNQTAPIPGQATAFSAYASTPPQNARVIWRMDTAGTVYLPSDPSDGARVAFVSANAPGVLTVDGNGRMVGPSDHAVLVPPFTPVTYFYRADIASWIPLAPLSLTDALPLPPEFDDLLVAGTAIRLTGLDEIEPTSGTMFIFNRLLKRCQQRYAQRAPTSYGGQNLQPSEQAYNQWDNGSPW